MKGEQDKIITIERFHLDNMIKGWFIGAFEPSLCKTDAVEVGIKKYKAGDYEACHHHQVATEFTAIISGMVEMQNVRYIQGDIIKIAPGISTDFKAITDVVTVVVKLPGASNDKYID